MSFIAPFWLAIAGVVGAGVVVAHLFSTNVPPRQVLPTVRFVPQGAPLAVLRTRRLTDVLLMLVRVLAVVLLGLALAGAHLPRRGPDRVVLIDVSRARAVDGPSASQAITAAAQTLPAPTDGRVRETFTSYLTIAFDSTARTVEAMVADTLSPSRARGSLSAGVVAAHRAIADVTTRRDSIELVIVSAFARESVDSATASLIALWDGPVRLVRVAAAAEPEPAGFEIRATGDDPVAAALSVIPRRRAPAGTRVVRGQPSAQDSAWARDSAHALVIWPMELSTSQTKADTVGGFRAGEHVVIGEFARGDEPGAGRVIARWIDGKPAATERSLGAGCVRDVAIPVDPVGDLALRDSFRGFVQTLMVPCGGARDFVSVPDSVLLGELQSPRSARNDGALARNAGGLGGLPVILVVMALAVLTGEQLLRRRSRTA